MSTSHQRDGLSRGDVTRHDVDTPGSRRPYPNDDDPGAWSETVPPLTNTFVSCPPNEADYSIVKVNEDDPDLKVTPEYDSQGNAGAAAIDNGGRRAGTPGCGCCSFLVNPIVKAVGVVIPAGGIFASGMSISGSTIGGGILGLPAGANRTGIVVACFYIIVMIVCSITSMRMLGITAMRTKIRSFEAMARYLFPQYNYAFSYFVALIRWFNSMGSAIVYVISTHDSFQRIFSDSYVQNPNNSALEFLSSTTGLRVMTVAVFFCVIVPMIIPRHVDTLRHAAAFAIVLMMYFCVVVVVHSCMHGLQENRHNVVVTGRYGEGDEAGKVFLFRTGNSCISALGTFVFAFICQVNAVEVFWDMPREIRGPDAFTKAAAVAVITCATIYTFIAIFGLFDFGAEALGSKSILLMFNPLQDPEVMLAYVGVLIKLFVAFALQFLAARNAFYYAIGFTERYASRKPSGNASDNASDRAHSVKEDAVIVSSTDVNGPGEAQRGQELRRPINNEEVRGFSMDESYVDNIPLLWHLSCVAFLAAICLILGLFIPDITIIFDFAGSICGGFLSLLLPALFVMYSGDFTLKKVGLFMWFMAHLLLVFGVIAVVFGTGATIYGLVGGS